MAKLQDIVTPQLQFIEGDAPETPASGVVRIYAKTDGLLYSKDDAGTEICLGTPAEVFTAVVHAATDHTGLTGVPSIVGLLDETAHALLDHTGVSGCGGVSSFTELDDVPAAYSGQAGKALIVNETATGLEFGVAGGDAVLPLAADPFKEGEHSGLEFAFGIGIVRADNAVARVDSGTVTLTDEATNYIEVTTTGVVSANTTGYTAGRIPLYTVVTASGEISSAQDDRCFFNVAAGGGAEMQWNTFIPGPDLQVTNIVI